MPVVYVSHRCLVFAPVRTQCQQQKWEGKARVYVKITHAIVKSFKHLCSGHQTSPENLLSAEIQFLYCLNRHVDNPNNLEMPLLNNLECSFQRHSQTPIALITEHVPESRTSLHRFSHTFGKNKMHITHRDSSAKKIGKKCKGYRMSSDSAP